MKSGGGGLLGLARGPGNSVWSIAQGPDEIFDQVDGNTASSSAVFSYPLPAGTDPHGLVEGPDGNLYFVSYAKSFVGQVTPDGKLTEFPIPAADKPSLPAAPPTTQTVVVDADGNVTFADGNQILRMSTSGAFGPPVVVSVDAQVDALTVFGGNVWFTESDGQVDSLAPGAAVSVHQDLERGVLTGITAGGDGNVYFCAGDELLGIMPTGLGYSLPLSRQFVGVTGADMVTDDDGNVWLAEPSAGRIAELDLNPTHSRRATTLAFTAQPTLSVAGSTIAPAVRVSALNDFGEVDTAASGSVTLSIAGGPAATLGGTLTEPLVNGVATFGDLSLSQPGIYTLSAGDAGDLPTISDSFAVTAAQVPTLAPKTTWPLVRPAVIAARPRLGGVPIPPPPVPGNTIFVTLTNETSTPMSGAATLRMFASPDGAVDADSILLLTRDRRVDLNPGQSTMVRIPASSIRNRLPFGQYGLVAEAVGPDGVVNDVASGLTVPTRDAFFPPTIDVGGVGPLTIAPGQWASSWVLIANGAEGGPLVGGRLTLVPSVDGVTPLLDHVLASVPIAPIAYNGNRNVLRFRVPTSLLSNTICPCVILTGPDYTETVISPTAVTLVGP